jgi:hypothetical protein
MFIGTFLAAGFSCDCGGGSMYDSRIGCSVTTLMKIDTIQKLAKMATFWISGIGATATTSRPMPSVTMPDIAGWKRCEYETMIACCLSCRR